MQDELVEDKVSVDEALLLEEINRQTRIETIRKEIAALHDMSAVLEAILQKQTADVNTLVDTIESAETSTLQAETELEEASDQHMRHIWWSTVTTVALGTISGGVLLPFVPMAGLTVAKAGVVGACLGGMYNVLKWS